MPIETISTRRERRIALSAPEQNRGMRLAYLSQAVGAHLFLFISASAICPLFIKKLGGSDLQAMLPATMSGLLLMVQIPISILVPPARGRKFMLNCWKLSSLPMLAVILAALGLGERQLTVWIVLASLIAIMSLLWAGATFWSPMIHDIVPTRRLGRFFGNIRAILGITYFALSILAGFFLGQSPVLWKFVLVFGVVTLLQMFRNFFIARIPVVKESGVDPGAWKEEVRYIIHNRRILIFAGYFIFLMFLAGFLGQPLVLYMNDLGFSARDNTLIYAASVLGSIVAVVVSGIILDRIGTRRMFLFVHVILSILALVVALVGELPVSWAKPFMTMLLILSGAALAVAQLASIAQVFHMAPASGKTVYMSIMVTVSAAGAAVSPFLTGLILDSSWRRASMAVGPLVLDIYQIVFLATGFGLIVAMVFLPFIQNIRAAVRPEPLT